MDDEEVTVEVRISVVIGRHIIVSSRQVLRFTFKDQLEKSIWHHWGLGARLRSDVT